MARIRGLLKTRGLSRAGLFRFGLPRVGLPRVGFDKAVSQFLQGPVMDSMDQAYVAWLKRMGAYIRRDANRSMRTDRSKKQRPSLPGRPPKSRVGYLKEFNFFIFDQSEQAMYVGPILLGSKVIGDTVPGVHEHGGVLKNPRSRRRQYPARPFMGPAADKNLKPRVDELRNSMK